MTWSYCELSVSSRGVEHRSQRTSQPQERGRRIGAVQLDRAARVSGPGSSLDVASFGFWFLRCLPQADRARVQGSLFILGTKVEGFLREILRATGLRSDSSAALQVNHAYRILQ